MSENTPILKHSPGPWIVHGRSVLAPRGQGVDEVIARDCDKGNARLISAAPDLYDALWAVLEGMEASGGWEGDDEIFDKGMAAIHKADGPTHNQRNGE